MKFFELNLSNGRKVRKNTWDKHQYAFLRDYELMGDNGVTFYSVSLDGWEYYQEPKQKKKVKLYAFLNKEFLDKSIDFCNYNLAYSQNEKQLIDYVRVPEFDKDIELEV
jgi:hypothetical protein